MSLVSDNVSQFKGKEFNAFLSELGIQHVYTVIYFPPSNVSERVSISNPLRLPEKINFN